MRNTCLLILILLVAFFAAGCPKNTPQTPAIFEKILDRQAAFVTRFDNELARYDCLMDGRTWNGTNCSGAFGTPTTAQKNEAQSVRDNVIAQLVRVIDYNYYTFEGDIYSRRATSSILADFLETGANMAGNITNGVRAKNIIFASISAFRTGRKSVNLNYYQEQTTNILVMKMQTARNRALKEILVQQGKSVDQYSLDNALGDAIKYFFAGTLPQAFQELQQDTSQQASAAKQDVLDFKGITVGKVATQDDRNIAFDANNALNNLATVFVAGSDSEKTAALGKLQKIVEDIQADTALITAINGNAILQPEMVTVVAQKNNGQNLATALSVLKGDAFGLIPDELVKKINTIIITNGSDKKK